MDKQTMDKQTIKREIQALEFQRKRIDYWCDVMNVILLIAGIVTVLCFIWALIESDGRTQDDVVTINKDTIIICVRMGFGFLSSFVVTAILRIMAGYKMTVISLSEDFKNRQYDDIEQTESVNRTVVKNYDKMSVEVNKMMKCLKGEDKRFFCDSKECEKCSKYEKHYGSLLVVGKKHVDYLNKEVKELQKARREREKEERRLQHVL